MDSLRLLWLVLMGGVRVRFVPPISVAFEGFEANFGDYVVVDLGI